MIVIFLVLILFWPVDLWCSQSCSVSSSSMLITHAAPALESGRSGRETNVQFYVLMFLCEKGHITILDEPLTSVYLYHFSLLVCLICC
jgi:hypothetical protein